MTTTISTLAKVNNGVNVTALLGAREALGQAPDMTRRRRRCQLLRAERTCHRPCGMSANDPGCVKTPFPNLRVESLSRLR
jgi:hypothetical protein